MKTPIKPKGIYFIKDEFISNSDEDYFKHQHFSKNIQRIISHNVAPFNIAIIGKWGIGKSSLIKFVRTYFENHKDNYLFHEINAWKYEKEALRKVFLKQIYLEIKKRENSNFSEKGDYRDYVEKLKNINIQFNYKNKTFKDGLKDIVLFLIQTAGILALFVFANIIIGYFSMRIIPGFENAKLVWNAMGQDSNIPFFPVLESTLNFAKTNTFMAFISSALVVLLKELFMSVKSSAIKNLNIQTPHKTADDYEYDLEEQLNNNKSLKIITVIDDLDRLSTGKIVEALDAIKAFVGFKNCIFIVPFDDEILKKALDKSKKQINLSSDMDTIESELFLDKLFQFKVYLPPLIEQDMRDYAIKLCDDKLKDLKELCTEDLFNELLCKILIHSYVSTPRQVKKIVNNFSNNLLIAFQREGGKVEKELLLTDDGIKFIAKLSVLQVDFNDFYDLLLLDHGIIKEFMEFYNDSDDKDVPKLLRKYFDKSGKLNPKVQPLASFLKRTERFEIENIEPFIYLAQDEITRLAGDSNSKSITRALHDGDSKPIIELLKENTLRITNYIINCIQNTETCDAANVVKVCIDIIDNIDEEKSISFANMLSENIAVLINNNTVLEYNLYDFKKVLKLYEIAPNKDGADKLICNTLIHRSEDVEKIRVEQFSAMLQLAFDKESTLSTNAKKTLKLVVDNIIGGKSVTHSALFCLNGLNAYLNPLLFESYFGIGFYQKVIKEIQNAEKLSQNEIEALKSICKILKKKYDSDEIVKPLVSLFLDLDMFNDVCEIIKPYYGTIGQNIATQIIINATQIYTDDIHDKTVELLENTNWIASEKLKYKHISDAIEIEKTSAELIDQLLLELLPLYDISNILKVSAKNKCLSLLKGTVSHVNKKVITSPEYDLVLQECIASYSDIQISDLTANVTSTFTQFTLVDKSVFERNIIITGFLLNNKYAVGILIEALPTAISNNMSYHSSQPIWSKYISEIIAMIFPDSDDVNKEKYLTSLFTNVFVSNPVHGFNCLRLLTDIPTTKLKECVEQVIANHTSLNMELVLDYLRNIIWKREKTTYTPYVDFLINNIKQDDFCITILKDMDFFSSLSVIHCTNFILNSYKLHGGEKEKALELSKKFFKASDKKMEIVQSMITNIGIVDFTFELLNDTLVDPAEEIIGKLPSILSEDSNTDVLYNVFLLQSKYKNFLDKNQILEILECNTIIDTPYLTEILCMLNEEYKAFFKKDEKRKLSTTLHNCFIKTSSEKVRNEIVYTVKVLGLKRQFFEHDFGSVDIAVYK